MNIIDEYVTQVTNKLPESQKQIVTEELTQKIIKKLPENYNEADIQKVLSELGEPEDVANQYRYKKRYLIGPKYFDSYLSMLKLVALILIIVVCASTIIEAVFTYDGKEGFISFIISTIVAMFSSSVEGLFQVFFFVTITYFFLEQSKFDTSKLPFIKYRPAKKVKATQTITDNLLSIIFNALFTYIICFQSEWIAWYTFQDGELQNTIPLFNKVILDRFIFSLLFLFILLTIISTLKMIYKKRTLMIAIMNAVYQVLVICLYTVMFKTETLFTTSFQNKFQSSLELSNRSFQDVWSGIITVLLVIIIVSSLIDAISGIVKWKKGRPL